MVLPFGLFMGFLALNGLVTKLAIDLSGDTVPFWLSYPEYWIYPLQALVCGGVMIYCWRQYDFNGIQRPLGTVLMGLLVLAIWIAPQFFPESEGRPEGFDPTLFENDPALYWATVGMRFLRLVVVVPFLEEIFWRGFLMRYMVNEQWRGVAFGTYRPLAFLGVALLFALAHAGPDFWVALITGLLYNALACWTRSLGACVLAHAITNLILGIYIMQTGQWGFW